MSRNGCEEEAEEKLGKFRKENKRFQGVLPVLKENINDVEKNISFLQEVYDEVPDQPYDDDSDEGESLNDFLEGYICQFDDLKYEEPENKEKEFFRIAVSVVAMLPNNIRDVEEHVSRQTFEVEKLLAQPLDEDEG